MFYFIAALVFMTPGLVGLTSSLTPDIDDALPVERINLARRPDYLSNVTFFIVQAAFLPFIVFAVTLDPVPTSTAIALVFGFGLIVLPKFRQKHLARIDTLITHKTKTRRCDRLRHTVYRLCNPDLWCDIGALSMQLSRMPETHAQQSSIISRSLDVIEEALETMADIGGTQVCDAFVENLRSYVRKTTKALAAGRHGISDAEAAALRADLDDLRSHLRHISTLHKA